MPPKRTLVGGTDSRAKRPKTGDGANSLVYERAPDMFNKGMGILRRVLPPYAKLSTVATLENANRARQNPPVAVLQEMIHTSKEALTTGTSVVYWMRMEDMRSTSPF